MIEVGHAELEKVGHAELENRHGNPKAPEQSNLNIQTYATSASDHVWHSKRVRQLHMYLSETV
jgi:hypothetical protein